MNAPPGAVLERFARGGPVNAWMHPTPAVYDPEIRFWSDPENHNQ